MDGRFNVIGCKITPGTMAEAIQAVLDRAKQGDGGYVCFTNVHATIMANENREFLEVVNNSFMSVADGKPVYWVGKLSHLKELEQIPGPDFFPKLLSVRSSPPLRHYFYGGKEEILKSLVVAIGRKYPDALIVGAESPPFRALSEAETSAALQRISAVRPDFVWVGLGAPKQEMWMARHWEELRPAVLLGVGAAFDFHANAVQRAPAWIRRIGLEWLHRLFQEPGRLWKRYFYTNTMFFWYLIKEHLGLEKRR